MPLVRERSAMRRERRSPGWIDADTFPAPRAGGGEMKILELIAERLPEKYALHEQYLNGQIVKVLKTIGYDVAYTEARGPYLFDARGNRYPTCSRAGACSRSGATIRASSRCSPTCCTAGFRTSCRWT
jgi:hypothetical protein